MCSLAETSLFWPGMIPAITEMRARCQQCNPMAPSQPSLAPTPPIDPAYLFQRTVADYFHHQGHNYLVVVDRYSNWPIVEEASHGAAGLIAALYLHRAHNHQDQYLYHAQNHQDQYLHRALNRHPCWTRDLLQRSRLPLPRPRTSHVPCVF